MKEVSVKKLSALISVYKEGEDGTDTWGTEVTLEDVKDRIVSNKLESRSFSDTPMDNSPYDHASRIAYLVLNKDDNPISLDVGIPSIGYHSIVLIDGNHRLAAAIYRKDKIIKVDYSGETAYFKHLFVRKSKKYQDI